MPPELHLTPSSSVETRSTLHCTRDWANVPSGWRSFACYTGLLIGVTLVCALVLAA